MAVVHTCLLLALASTVLAVHEHYKHLDLGYVSKETRRLTYMDRQQIYAKVNNNRMAVQIIKERRDTIFSEEADREVAAARWKKDYEAEYCDDIDRALIVQSLCQKLYDEDTSKCDVGIHWGHDLDTRDETLRKEFLTEVEDVIKSTLD
jgi:hypothetical protein